MIAKRLKRRFRFRYGLRLLMIITAINAIVVFPVANVVTDYRKEQAAAKRLGYDGIERWSSVQRVN